MNSENEEIYTVSQVCDLAKSLLEGLPFMWVFGEITDLSQDKYAYRYFSIKDENGYIKVIIPSAKLKQLNLELENGAKVYVYGKTSIYIKQGTFQFIASNIKLENTRGELLQKIEELKNKLYIEGLFDEKWKKKIPAIPEKIGLITSKDSAAYKDFIKIVNDRFPMLHIYLFNALMQGDRKAEDSIIDGIDTLDKLGNLDLIVITRGGGSNEDLLLFNNENIARKVFSANTPIVSAIGHEKDFSILDLVADLRCSTPSNAAESITPEKEQLMQFIDETIIKNRKNIYSLIEYNSMLINIKKDNFLKQVISSKYEDIKNVFSSIKDKFNLIHMDRTRILYSFNFKAQLNIKVTDAKNIENLYSGIRSGFKLLYKDYANILDIYKLKSTIDMKYIDTSKDVDNLIYRINAVDPKNITKKGYSITRTRSGHVIRTINDVKAYDEIETILADGNNILSTVK